MVYYVAAGIWAVLSALGTQMVRKHYNAACTKLRLRGVLAGDGARKLLFVCLAVASALPLALLSGLRYDVGTDYSYTYIPAFDTIAAGAGLGESRMEPGFWLLVKGIQLLGGGPGWMFFISSLLVVGFFVAGIYRLSPLPWYGMALFLLTQAYFISMNGVRQYMGLAIIFFGFAYLGAGDKKPCFWRWALCVVAGALFHYSNLLFLPLFFWVYLKANPFVGAAAVMLVSAFNNQLYDLAKWLVFLTPYSAYWGSAFHASALVLDARLAIHLLVLLLALCYWRKNGNAEKPMYRFFYYCTLFAVFLSLNQNLVPLAPRLAWGLEMCQILFLPMIAFSEERRWLRWVILAAAALAWGQLCYHQIFVLGWHEVNHYQNILFLG